MKKIKLEKSATRPGLVEIWKFNKRGYYNFVEHLQMQEISKISKQFKGYEIVDKQHCLGWIYVQIAQSY